jgi:PAS domain S-box-containing protein
VSFALALALWLLALALVLGLALAFVRRRLGQAARRDRALADAIPDLVFVLGRDGTYREIKGESGSRLATPPENLVGARLEDVLPADVAARVLAATRRALDRGALESVEYELELDGETRLFEARLVVSGDDEVTAIVRDFTEIRRLQTELERRYEERGRERDFIRAVVDNTSAIFCVVDVEGRIVRFNRACERTTGFDDDDAIRGKRFWEAFVAPEEAAGALLALADVTAGRPPAEQENQWVRKDGGRVVIAWSIVPIVDEAGAQRYLISGADVTEHKRQEQELGASRARIVAAADAERRRLERNLHDGAQQRLVSLSLALRLARNRIETDPPGARRVLESANEELEQALEELRELARGIHPAVLTDRGLAAALETLAARAPLPVEVAALPADRLPERVEAAAYYLVSEALTNVAKYARASAVTISVARADGIATVEIADDGIGGADPTLGSGIRGLADRVSALSGELEVESPPGEGTRLRARIPIG